MVKYIDIRKNAVELFERSKYRKLEKLICDVDLSTMRADQLVELIAFKALILHKLYKKYWPEEISALADEARRRASDDDLPIVDARLYLNAAQIIIRNKKGVLRYTVAIELLRRAEKVFRDRKLDAEMLFVQDEILRTQLEEFRSEHKESFNIAEFVANYKNLIFKMEALLESGSGDQETLKTWLLNVKFHFLRSLAYFGDKKARTLSVEVANEFSARGDKAKSVAATFYGLGEVGFYINQLLAKVKGE